MFCRRDLRTLIGLLLLVLILSYTSVHRSSHLSSTVDEGRYHHRPHLRPVGLPTSEYTVHAGFPRIIHHCRSIQPDWEWVLWTDYDNLNLIQESFPDLLAMYTGLRGNIYRADLMRYIYMYLFGG